jgi:hypothetical protein
LVSLVELVDVDVTGGGVSCAGNTLKAKSCDLVELDGELADGLSNATFFAAVGGAAPKGDSERFRDGAPFDDCNDQCVESFS